MGEVYRPEDIDRKRRGHLADIKPGSPSFPITPSVEALAQEVEKLKLELEKIKKTLNAHGIRID